jgi:hypothetical protein
MYDPEALQRWEALEKRQLADDNRLRGGRRRLWWQHRQSEADPEEHWSRMQRQLLAIDHYTTSYSSSLPSFVSALPSPPERRHHRRCPVWRAERHS